jgi:hypothetical protein
MGSGSRGQRGSPLRLHLCGERLSRPEAEGDRGVNEPPGRQDGSWLTDVSKDQKDQKVAYCLGDGRGAIEKHHYQALL